MPEVQLPTDFEVNDIVDEQMSLTSGGSSVVSMRGESDDRNLVSVYIILQFDDFYINLTTATPDVTFQFFQLPTFDNPTDNIVYRPESFNDIDIWVRASLVCQ